MPRTRLVMHVSVAALTLAASNPARASDPAARRLLERAVAAQGGEAKLRPAHTVEWRMEGYRNMLEQSERPDGPYIPELQAVREVHDFAGQRFAASIQARVPFAYKAEQGYAADAVAAVRIAGPRKAPGTPDMVASARDLLALAPERLLITALDAPDLALGKTVTMQSIPQDVARFTLNGSPVTLFLNHFTHLPTAVDYAGPAARQAYWQFAGDVTMRTYYSSWWLGDGGIHLPLQWDIYRNGLPDSTLVASSVTWNAAPDPAFIISPELKAAFLKQSEAPRPAPKPQAITEIAPGVTFLGGPWNVALVRQSDGLVVIEAPISSAYSEEVLATAAKLYPGVPVKAVVTTSDAWPHVAGIRSYIARGIPIYGLKINQEILGRFATASYAHHSDELQKRPRKPRFVLVDAKTTIGSGANSLELYPLRGELSERQMMIYLPGLHLLYGSDPFQETPDGYQTKQAVDELVRAVDKEGLKPTRFFMMHIPVTDWGKLPDALSTARLTFPNGKLD